MVSLDPQLQIQDKGKTVKSKLILLSIVKRKV